MKNYNKKLVIMFVMLLAVIGFGTIENVTVANAATVGQTLTQPEDGWKRYDDTDSNIDYGNKDNLGNTGSSLDYSGGAITAETIKIYAKTDKIRLGGALSTMVGYRCGNIAIDIDGSLYRADQNKSIAHQGLFFDKQDLENKIHCITIYVDNDTTIASAYNSKFIALDYIDIDKDGYLLSPSISLDKSSMDLTVSDSKQLTATTTPSGAQVVWSSSDESIATVDETGNVTGIKEGQAIITATINDGSNLSASCTVNVTKEDTTEPTDPEEPVGDGSLLIELVDGNIKTYDVTSDEIEDFIDWYKGRDLDDSESPVYKFNKGDYKDYVVHDKIDWFEIR